MRRIYVLIHLVLCGIFANAQTNTLPTTGNVGVGTLSPGSPLTVIGDAHATGSVGGNGMYNNVLKIPPLGDSPGYFYMNTSIPANDSASPQIHITGYMYGNAGNTGNVINRAMRITLGWYYYQGGFYWSQWQSDLGYRKPSRVRLGTYVKNGASYIRIEIANDGSYWSNYSVSGTDGTGAGHAQPNYSGWTFNEGEMPTGTTSMITTVSSHNDVLVDGKIGIGINTPTEKLEVNGKIRAREIKVENTNWPDYVFAPSYKLPTLQETEKHIKEKGHLPGIPSASEVKANGVELGSMNAKLLQKIEELTLHLIEMKKENQEVKDRLQKLEGSSARKIK
ncbi:hypothetical protein [Pedobacter frigoris]|uniref:Uncharacterized protein n=1 Tax=Pedobacter frigoris TaxID=2571272 RepID=A0A4U1CAG6_9SPHI|nr:hypothetical protein [Pedobacter frigoris]TKC02813.1 hypothetical protein FA047_20115 [Pedobacter frigoris]